MSTIGETETRTGEPITAARTPNHTRMISELVDDAGWVRNSANLIVADGTELRNTANRVQTDAFDQLLDEKTVKLSGNGVQAALADLSDLGFSWQDVAAMAGVSVPGLRKWRQGESPTVENRDRLFRLLAFMALVGEQCGISDQASWLEMPIRPGVPISGIDLLSGKHFDLAFEHARDHGSTAELVLDRFDADWRSHLDRRTETFEASDGQLSIRAKNA